MENGPFSSMIYHDLPTKIVIFYSLLYVYPRVDHEPQEVRMITETCFSAGNSTHHQRPVVEHLSCDQW